MNNINENAKVIDTKYIQTSIVMNYINKINNPFRLLSVQDVSKDLHIGINQAFNTAMNKGYIMQNPMINVIRPKSDKENKIVRALTVEEQQNFTNWLINL